MLRAQTLRADCDHCDTLSVQLIAANAGWSRYLNRPRLGLPAITGTAARRPAPQPYTPATRRVRTIRARFRGLCAQSGISPKLDTSVRIPSYEDV
jgi:hypothetical protein